jgi:hypothetical protein
MVRVSTGRTGLWSIVAAKRRSPASSTTGLRLMWRLVVCSRRRLRRRRVARPARGASRCSRRRGVRVERPRFRPARRPTSARAPQLRFPRGLLGLWALRVLAVRKQEVSKLKQGYTGRSSLPAASGSSARWWRTTWVDELRLMIYRAGVRDVETQALVVTATMEQAEPEFEEVGGDLIARTLEIARSRETGEVAYERDSRGALDARRRKSRQGRGDAGERAALRGQRRSTGELTAALPRTLPDRPGPMSAATTSPGVLARRIDSPKVTGPWPRADPTVSQRAVFGDGRRFVPR